MSQNLQPEFENITALIKAHINRFPTDENPGGNLLTEIKIQKTKNPHWGFKELFSWFLVKYGIYGFGDLQFRNLLNQIDSIKN